ncbi:C25 family cysteine peptidase [Fibrobacterota bacterium]
MTKKLIIVLLIPCVLFSGVLKREYSFESPFIAQGAISVQGCRNMRAHFVPSVPVKPVSLLVPYGHKVVSYNITYDEPIKLTGSHYVRPFRAGGRIDTAPSKEYLTRRSSVYDMDELFPGKVSSERFFMLYKNGHAIFNTKLFPVQYNPVSGEILYYTNIAVTVTTEAARAPPGKVTPYIKSFLANIIDNKEAVNSLPLTPKAPGDYEYLIITLDALQNAFTSFIEFNKRRCMRSKVITIPYIKSNFTGDDDADKIRNCIKQEYEDHNIVYVLLGADDDNNNANDLAHRGMRSEIYDYGTDYTVDNDIAADLYFSCLDGDWKGSNQYYGDYGSEDIGWEVYAARFTVDDQSELNNIVNKTIKYMEEPVVNEVKNNLLAGEYLWGPPNHPKEGWGKLTMTQHLGECTLNNYTTKGFPNSWSTSTLFDMDQTWNSSDLINTVKNDKVTWIDHDGHSNNNYILKVNSSSVTNSNFTNNGTIANYFIVYTQGCYPAAFDNRTGGGSYTSDCIGEKFTAEISNGALAFIGCSRYGLGDDGYDGSSGHDGSNQRLHRYFHDAIFNKKIHYLQMMDAYSKEMNKDIICDPDLNKKPYYGQLKWCCYNVNILGDPAASLWTEEPQELQADHPTTISSTTFTWDTKIPYTWVALLTESGDSILCAQLTGEDGKCEMEEDGLSSYLAANPNGKLKINVKAHNYLPYQGEIQINLTGISNTVKKSLKSWFMLYGKTARISYTLPVQGMVNISIYNSKGTIIKTVLNTQQNSGDHTVIFCYNNLSNGIYYCTMTAGNNKIAEKFIVSK